MAQPEGGEKTPRRHVDRIDLNDVVAHGAVASVGLGPKRRSNRSRHPTFAHTLPQTGSLNFSGHANMPLADGLQPARVLTRIYVEAAKRARTSTVYRRIGFEQLDSSE